MRTERHHDLHRESDGSVWRDTAARRSQCRADRAHRRPIGPNGAGKTTLLHVVSGFVTPVRGLVKLDDMDLLGLSPTRRVALGVRRTFQQEYVVDDLTLWENVLSVADHVSPSRRGARDETARAIDFVGLDRRVSIPGRRANLFERRMTEIAKALTGRPRVVLLDEPGAGLNEGKRIACASFSRHSRNVRPATRGDRS